MTLTSVVHAAFHAELTVLPEDQLGGLPRQVRAPQAEDGPPFSLHRVGSARLLDDAGVGAGDFPRDDQPGRITDQEPVSIGQFQCKAPRRTPPRIGCSRDFVASNAVSPTLHLMRYAVRAGLGDVAMVGSIGAFPPARRLLDLPEPAVPGLTCSLSVRRTYLFQ